MIKYMKWIEALRLWNSEHNKGTWCVPRKGTPEHAVVKALMGDSKVTKEAKAKAEAAEEMATVPTPKKKKTVTYEEEPEIDYDKMYKEERLKEIGVKSKKTKVKAFLKKLLAKRKAKKAEVEDVRDYFIEEGYSSVMRADEYENAFIVNMNMTLTQAEEAAETVRQKHPEQAVFYKAGKSRLKIRKYEME